MPQNKKFWADNVEISQPFPRKKKKKKLEWMVIFFHV